VLFADPFAMPASARCGVREHASLASLASLRLGEKHPPSTLAIAFGLVLGGCGGGPAAARPPALAAVLATNMLPPVGVTLVEACTPTGPELCFNAVDDNCNGVIDEGCGLQTGLLQFVIAWGTSPADVNLVVVTPQDERVPDGRTRSTASGFHLDRDCPGDEGCAGQNVENVYFDGPEPPRGKYTVDVKLVDLHGADPPLRVRFGARVGARSIGFDVDLAPGDNSKKTFSFELP
jgi:hypothetical protein